MKHPKKITLHIGYHKTGTTFLQNTIFSNLNNTLFLGKPWINNETLAFVNNLVQTHDLNFSPDLLKKELHEILNEFPEQNFLLSSEGLHSGFGWYGRETLTMCRRIYEVFYPAKIIIAIRNQSSYLKSYYKQYVKEGGTLSFKSFLNSPVGKHQVLPKLLYSKVINQYYDLFGRENVLVILHEEMLLKQLETINIILTFLDEKPLDKIKFKTYNKGLSDSSIKSLLLLNKFISKGHQKNKRLRGSILSYFIHFLGKLDNTLSYRNNKKLLFNEDEHIQITSYYRSSNKELKKMINKNIDKFKYYSL